MRDYITRERYKERIDRYIGKEIIKVLTGQRRVGKSYLLFQITDSIREKFPEANIVHINLEMNDFRDINTSEALYGYIKSRSRATGMKYVMSIFLCAWSGTWQMKRETLFRQEK